MWKDDTLNDCAIQQRLSDKCHHADRSDSNGRLAYSFVKFMFDKHTLVVVRGRFLHLSEVVNVEENTTVQDTLESKHPSAVPLYPECLDTTFDSFFVRLSPYSLDDSMIHVATLCTSESVEPSGVGAYDWRQLCIADQALSFHRHLGSSVMYLIC